jgi:hypothetical protein
MANFLSSKRVALYIIQIHALHYKCRGIDEINNIRSMQNSVRWHSDQLDGAVVGSFWGTPSQTKVMRM